MLPVPSPRCAIGGRPGLSINNGMIRLLTKNRRRYLTAQVAIDASIVDEEVAWNVFGMN